MTIADSASNSKKVNLLLVDDKPNNLLTLEAVLGTEHYNFTTAATGFEAIELVKKQDFGLILLDVQMPGIDGFETARRIKELDGGKDVPIIFVTATYKEDPFFLKGYEVGAIDYFGKPFNPDILKAKVRIYTELQQKKYQIREQERRLAQTAALLQEERKLKTILRTLSEGVIVADVNGKITQANEEAFKIWGVAVGANFPQVEDYRAWYPSTQRKKDCALARALKTGEIVHNEVIQIEAFDGGKKEILNSASPLRDGAGKIVGAVAVLQDITPKTHVGAF